MEPIANPNYIVVPRANYESWEYLPVAITNKINAGNYWTILPESQLYQFGVLSSSMHMTWIKCVSGRVACYDRLHHSPTIKNFPWPITHTQAHILAIEERAAHVLNLRSYYASTPLSELYNPLNMPIALREAHQALDEAVDAAYGQAFFASDDSRVGFLLNLQHKLSALLLRMNNDIPEVQFSLQAGKLPTSARTNASIF